jgi:SAM-dependent methyltransferase
MLAQRYPRMRIAGHDQSAYLIRLARERAAESLAGRATIPSFSVGDCRTVPHEPSSFDFVMVMGNSFGYFSQNDDGEEGDRAVLKEAARFLKLGGQIVLDLADGDYLRKNYNPRYCLHIRQRGSKQPLDRGSGLTTRRLSVVNARFPPTSAA